MGKRPGVVARLPIQIVNDKGRYHSHTVIEDLEGCPETGFWEIIEHGRHSASHAYRRILHSLRRHL